MKKYSKSKILLLLIITLFTSLLFVQITKAEDSPTGDIVDFGPASNWYTWFIRVVNETGHGQKFLTTANTEAISTVAFKLCRLGNFTKPKTLTLCDSATNGWYAGCSSPLASKVFTAEELNEMINYDASCNAGDEGGTNDGLYYKWAYFTFDTPVSVSGNTNYFVLLNSSASADNEPGSLLRTMYNNSNYLGSSENYPNGQAYYYKGATRYTTGESTDIFFKIFSSDPIVIPFEITSHDNDSPAINDSYITVSGTCPINGENRIGFTNDCLGYENIEYNVDCVDNEFSGQFYHEATNHRLIAREISSVSGDCVDYDDLMDYITLSGLEIIEGYPDDWYFNFDYYDDYDIEITSPIFDVPALTLPLGSSAVDMSFSFIYPHPLSPFLVFNIKQYDETGNLLNDSYHNKALYEMTDTNNYIVNLTASSSPIHYVVQLLNNGDLVRQYPFGVFVSDLDLIINPDEYRYLFPRLVEKMKKKVVFNYYFAFYDGFYSLFNGSIPVSSDDALDITFKSVSGDGQYNLNVPIFKGSDPNVKTFTSGLRPYITAFLWLVFALYLVIKINGLFNSDE